jgi:hypothetical protein
MSIITKIKNRSVGRDYNFFQKVTVTGSNYGSSTPDGYTIADGYYCDLFITFPTTGIIFHTEGTLSTSVIEYSFNGRTTHGELIPATANVAGRNTITFLNRKVTSIWFRVKSGSAGPVLVSVEAWGD